MKMKPVNKKGFNEKTCVQQDFPEAVRANKIETEEGIERYCGICGKLVTSKDLMEDETMLSFILRVVYKSPEDGTKKMIPQVFTIHKDCYLNHFKIMKGIIEHYKDDFFIEGL